MFGVTSMSGLHTSLLKADQFCSAHTVTLQQPSREIQSHAVSRDVSKFKSHGNLGWKCHNICSRVIHILIYWGFYILKKVKLQFVKQVYLQAEPSLRSFSTGMCHSKAPRGWRRNSSFSWWFNTIFHPFTPTVHHLVTQTSVFNPGLSA